MNGLKINGNDYEVKFNHRFYNRVVEEFAKKNKNSDTDGFNNLIAGLISEDPDAVVRAYRCACQSKVLPSMDAVGDALEDAGLFESNDVFSETYNAIKDNGFLAMKIQHLLKLLKDNWKNSEIALKVVKENAGKRDQKDIQQAETEVEINRQAFELAKNQLQDLDKQ